MLVEKITSRQNPLIKRFRRVRTGVERGFVLIEGVRLVEEALSSGIRFESIAYSPALESQERGLALLDKLRAVPCRGANVSTQVMQAIADTESPQGVLAIISRPFYEPGDLFGDDLRFIIIADQLQDPGNLGAIIRTAEAAGASGLLTTRNTVDPFNQKALRASMGSAFRLPIATGARVKELVSHCGQRDVRLVIAQPADDKGGDGKASARQSSLCYTDAKFSDPFALVFGKESEGVSGEMSAAASEFIFVPMAPGVESLNVSAAAAIVLYEAARQRNFTFV